MYFNSTSLKKTIFSILKKIKINGSFFDILHRSQHVSSVCKALRYKDEKNNHLCFFSFLKTRRKSTMSSKIDLNNEIDLTLLLCSHISQLVQKTQQIQMEKMSFEKTNFELHREELLSTIETIDGVALLLESLLDTQRRHLLKRRFSYDRNQLVELRENVSSKLSDETREILRTVVDREVTTIKTSENNIRSILS